MKIVFLDKSSLGECELQCISKYGELVCYDNTSPEKTIERIGNADAVISNKVIISKEVMDACPSLKYIGVAATGTNNVDLTYAAKKNIVVTNVKGYSTNTVVQHTFALLFAVMEQTNYYDTYIKGGKYSKSGLFTNLDRPYGDLMGKTWGIIGLGEIGRGVASVAEAFGCNVIYYSTSGKNDNSTYKRVTLDELLDKSDVISIHAPLNDATMNLMDKTAFSKMKKTAYLINVGRGPIINEKDLAEALDDNRIAGAGLDVFEKEPIPEGNPLLCIKNNDKLIMTPHIAWASIEARKRLIKEMALNIEAYLNGENRNRVI